MKFVLIVLAIHLVIELVAQNRKNKKIISVDEVDGLVRHPAEFDTR